MGFPCFLLILFLSFHPTSPSTNPTPDFIQQTCRNTDHYDLCVSSLESDSSSPQADTKGLALIMLRLGVANATSTTSYLSSAINDTDAAKNVTNECSSRYGFASEALQNAVRDLSDEMYDYVYMHVMAASDYPTSCHNAFKRYSRLIYPAELVVRGNGLKSICDVVLGIIEGMGF